MTESVADILARIADINQRIGPLLIELLNSDAADQPARLRELGQHLGELSAILLARAAELDGRMVDGVGRVVIDARS